MSILSGVVALGEYIIPEGYIIANNKSNSPQNFNSELLRNSPYNFLVAAVYVFRTKSKSCWLAQGK